MPTQAIIHCGFMTDQKLIYIYLADFINEKTFNIFHNEIIAQTVGNNFKNQRQQLNIKQVFS